MKLTIMLSGHRQIFEGLCIGLQVVKEAKAQGASRIIGIDNNDNKSENGTVFKTLNSLFCCCEATIFDVFMPSGGFVGKNFGITDFLNPDSLHKPVHEVIIIIIIIIIAVAFLCIRIS